MIKSSSDKHLKKGIVKMTSYHSTMSNKKGDIISIPTGPYSNENMLIIIPHKYMMKSISNKKVFNSLRIIIPIFTIILSVLILSAPFASKTIIALTMVIVTFSIGLSCTIYSPEIITGIGGKRIAISPKYFSSKNYYEVQNIKEWEKQHQTEFLDLLDNELIRDVFIKLLNNVEKDNVSPKKSKELYKYMKEVGLTEKDAHEKEINDMIEKYQYYADAINDIKHIS